MQMVMGYSKYRRSKRKTTVRRRKSTGTKRKSTKRRVYRRKRRTYRKRKSYRGRYRRRGLSNYMMDPSFLAGVNAAADVIHADMATQTDLPSDLGVRRSSELSSDMPVKRLSADFS